MQDQVEKPVRANRRAFIRNGGLATAGAAIGLGLLPKGSPALLGPAQIQAMLHRALLQINTLQKQVSALKQNAAAVILAHPHPSGVAEPSQADEFITRRLKEALDLVDIRVLDHIIVAGGDTTSMAERGLL